MSGKGRALLVGFVVSFVVCVLVADVVPITVFSTEPIAADSNTSSPRIGGHPFVSPAVAYQPRAFNPELPSSSLSREQIAADLRLLRKAGFRSLVTYGSSGALGFVPEVARQERFDGTLVMGIWDPFSLEEWTQALAQSRFVDGYCLGNEGLGHRYSPDALAVRMRELRHATGLPVTTAEPIDSYLQGPHRDWLLANSDWLFPLAHPFFAGQLDPQRAVDWTVVRVDYLAATSGREVILKEAGLPTAGARGATPDAQTAFFRALDATRLSWFFFEAFDQPWKAESSAQLPVEAHWGLFRPDGAPKSAIQWVASRWSSQ